MSIVRKTSAGAALILLTLLSGYVGCTVNLALARYDAPPEDQYDLPARDQYAPPPGSTAPLPEDRSGGGDTNGDEGGGTTAPLDDDNDGGDGEDGAAVARASDRSPPENALSRSSWTASSWTGSGSSRRSRWSPP